MRRAESYDKPALFADAIRLLLGQLISKPNEVGEPMYRLQSMKMDVRRVALAPVYLEYGVHRTEPLVIVRRVVGMAERNSDYRSRPSVSNALHHTATGTFARTIK